MRDAASARIDPVHACVIVGCAVVLATVGGPAGLVIAVPGASLALLSASVGWPCVASGLRTAAGGGCGYALGWIGGSMLAGAIAGVPIGVLELWSTPWIVLIGCAQALLLVASFAPLRQSLSMLDETPARALDFGMWVGMIASQLLMLGALIRSGGRAFR